MKPPSEMTRSELLIALLALQASTDVAWHVAGSLVEKVAELEKLLAAATSKDKDSERSP